MSRLCFVDIETTSLDDRTGEVWEIGIIDRTPGQDDVEHLWQVRPTLRHADPKSLEINRYYERSVLRDSLPGAAAKLTGAGTYVEAPARAPAYHLAELLTGAHVVGGNPSFDHRFLRAFLAEHGETWMAHYHLIDVQVLALGWLYGIAAGSGLDERMAPTGLPWRSTDLYRAVGINPDDYEAHTALGDARLVRDVFDAVTGGAR